MAVFDLELIRKKAEKEIRAATKAADLDMVFQKYLGQEGLIRQHFQKIGRLPTRERRRRGAALNQLKEFLAREIDRRKEILKKEELPLATSDFFDPDKPGYLPPVGRLHPLTQSKREIISIFSSLGFEVTLGPEIEDERHNFDALNIPKEHPARDAWNTIWLKEPENSKLKTRNSKLLLRTHTSPVQVRYLERHRPPLRIIAPGKVFRQEATDVRHEAQFYQLEGLMVDKKVSVANFKSVIAEFLKRFFNQDLRFRLRPDFFPFTEPSFDVAMTCLTCRGRGCLVCKKTGWLEVAGAGMVHPAVIRAGGWNPQIWKGWAFGFGWDRLTMMKYKINDIRLFNSGNLRFLEQF